MMKKTCLVIDDVEVSRFASLLALEALGFVVIEAESVTSALKEASSQPVDLVLLDWHLRGEEGLSLIAKLRALPGKSALPIIVFSGVEAFGNAAAEKAGANAFISKPTTEDKLKVELQKLGLLG